MAAENFLKNLKKGLQNGGSCGILIKLTCAAEMNIRVWRSLVSRLNGVQEAAGSSPVTRTTSPRTAYRSRRLFLQKSPLIHSVAASFQIEPAALGFDLVFFSKSLKSYNYTRTIGVSFGVLRFFIADL